MEGRRTLHHDRNLTTVSVAVVVAHRRSWMAEPGPGCEAGDVVSLFGRIVAIVCAATSLLVSVSVLAPAAGAEEPAAERIEPGALGPGPTARYVDDAHRLFLGRDAVTAEIDRWSPVVHRDDRPAMTRALVTSPEAAGFRVDELYRVILGREPDPTGRAHWIRGIGAGARLEDVAAGFYGSDEHFAQVGGTHRAYVDSLYQDILGRDADADGRDSWVARLDGGHIDRAGLARAFHASIESRRGRVRDAYATVLGRDVDPGGLDHWSEQLAVIGALDLAAQLAASPEYHRRATGLAPADVQFLPVGPGTAHPLSASWRPGCPVHPRDLVAVEFPHHTPDGPTAAGVLIVHRTVADATAKVVRTLWGTAFPLTSARTVDDFGGDDDASMAADNSSAFNCRTVAGTTTWSQHAFGTAIDVNPERNPYVRGASVEPPSGRAWLDRSDVRPGMVVEGGPVVRVFDGLGWGWGGRWTSSKDYQHFSTNGR